MDDFDINLNALTLAVNSIKNPDHYSDYLGEVQKRTNAFVSILEGGSMAMLVPNTVGALSADTFNDLGQDKALLSAISMELRLEAGDICLRNDKEVRNLIDEINDLIPGILVRVDYPDAGVYFNKNYAGDEVQARRNLLLNMQKFVDSAPDKTLLDWAASMRNSVSLNKPETVVAVDPDKMTMQEYAAWREKTAKPITMHSPTDAAIMWAKNNAAANAKAKAAIAEGTEPSKAAHAKRMAEVEKKQAGWKAVAQKHAQPSANVVAEGTEL